MNQSSYEIALSYRDELLRQAADYRLTHPRPPSTARLSKPTRRTPLKLRRGFLPKSA
jgi:hypothetical protein